MPVYSSANNFIKNLQASRTKTSGVYTYWLMLGVGKNPPHCIMRYETAAISSIRFYLIPTGTDMDNAWDAATTYTYIEVNKLSSTS